MKIIIPVKIKKFLRKILHKILYMSLVNAAKEQCYDNLLLSLKSIVPDISEQYSSYKLDTDYLLTNVRNLHAFQISLVDEIIHDLTNPVIVDIGDSAGTHLKYLLGLYSSKMNITCLSVNLDSEAIRKIKAKRLDAMLSRAEDLHKYNINPDIFTCFETLEHLMNPCQFLHQLSTASTAKYLIVTVPYLRRSRIGLHHIRNKSDKMVGAESTHLYELCPEDWKLIVKHAGWEVVKEKRYLQYPKKHYLRLTKPLWVKFDFEGFYGLILKRDDTWSSRYSDWQ